MNGTDKNVVLLELGVGEMTPSIIKLQNVVDTTFGDMASKVDDFTKTSIQDFGMTFYGGYLRMLCME